MSETSVRSADVTVVIPVHNRPTAVLAAIDSVLAQTTSVREIIVVDDASSDGTPDAVTRRIELGGPIKLIALPTNQGGGHARNVGADAAAGALVAFLDSDDLWAPNKLEVQLSRVGETTQDFVCFSNLAIDYADGEAPRPWNHHPFGVEASATDFMMRLDQAIQTSTLLMPANLARRVRFNDSLRRHQDLDFVLRLERSGARFVYASETLVRYSADPMATRVSFRKNASPSLAWLEVAENYLPQDLRDRFYLRHVYDIHFNDAPVASTIRGFGCVTRGAVSPLSFARTTLGRVTPTSIKDALRGPAKRARR